MHSGGYSAEVTCLSPNATDKDVYDFFTHCGSVEHVEIIRSGEHARTAYVTFRDAYALETALLLTGAKIADKHVHIAPWGTYEAESDPWGGSSWNPESNYGTTTYYANQCSYTPVEAVTKAQEVVKVMLSKGYVLGKDALMKAKELDESHGLTAMAAAKFADISKRIGLTDTIYASMETVKSADERLHVSEITKSVMLVTGTAAVAAASVTSKAAVAAGSAMANTTYFAKGALWLSDILNRAAKTTSDLAAHSHN